jgi:beta-fructofuranosidase
MLELADHWVWDSWFVRDGDVHHMFFLRASRALIEPERRHMRATVGHAVSWDLCEWELCADALVPADLGAWDDEAIWTGSVVRDDDDAWHMFYTARKHGDARQRVGHATSADLHVWHRVGDGFVNQADPRWYETLEHGLADNEAWRDPWVYRVGGEWHMTVTARTPELTGERRSALAHATSDDLLTWTTAAPLAVTDQFGELEVTQIVEVDGVWVLLFSVGETHIDATHRAPLTGMYTAPADGPLGPFHIERAELLTPLYAGKVVHHTDGHWYALGFRGYEDGAFVGAIGDPERVRLTPRGTLETTS